MSNHFEFTNDCIIANGAKHYQIKATEDLPDFSVKEGDLGGYVHETALLGKGSWVRTDALIGKCVKIGDGVWIGEKAQIDKKAAIGNFTNIGDGAWIGNNASNGEKAQIGKRAKIQAYANVVAGERVGDNEEIDSW